MFLLFSTLCCIKDTDSPNKENSAQRSVQYEKLFSNNPTFSSDGFDFPLPETGGYNNSQPFDNEHNHSGEDWNGPRGGDTDLGDPVFSIANGWIANAEDYGGGWCNVLRIIHNVNGSYVESIYAHLNTMKKSQGDWVVRGEQIGTIGKCGDECRSDGFGCAHLHLEIRKQPDMPLGSGYSSKDEWLVEPTQYIKHNRPD